MTSTTASSAASERSSTERRALRLGWRDARGQAMTETMLLTWIMLVFFAAAYQMFMVNETVYRTIAAVHAQLMREGFDHNCYQIDKKCEYNTDKNAHPIWSEQNFPEIRIPTVKMFGPFGLSTSLIIYSNYPGRMPEPSKGCPLLPCKKTKMGAGAGGPSKYYTKDLARPLDFSGYGRLYSKMFWALGFLGGDWFAAFGNRFNG